MSIYGQRRELELSSFNAPPVLRTRSFFSYSASRHRHLDIQLVVKLSEHKKKDALQSVGNSGKIQATRKICSFFDVRRHATRGRSYFHRRRSNAGACLTAEDITHVPSKKTAVVIFQLIRRSSRFRRSLLMKLREFSKFDVYQRNMKCNLSP